MWKKFIEWLADEWYEYKAIAYITVALIVVPLVLVKLDAEFRPRYRPEVVCIDGTKMLMYGRSLTYKLDKDGKIIPCKE